ncbi:hypothetical protein BC831DRAFT_439937, partial [Entophlyctis helioformis]
MTVIAVLSSEEEEVALQRFKKSARDKCRSYLDDLVNCTRHRTFSLVMMCREQNRKVQECVQQYTTESDLDRFREEELLKKREFLKSIGKWPVEELFAKPSAPAASSTGELPTPQRPSQ